jgi:hypothetical protein
MNRFEALVVVQLRLKEQCQLQHCIAEMDGASTFQLQNSLVNELFYIITLIIKSEPRWF